MKKGNTENKFLKNDSKNKIFNRKVGGWLWGHIKRQQTKRQKKINEKGHGRQGSMKQVTHVIQRCFQRKSKRSSEEETYKVRFFKLARLEEHEF